MNKGEITLRDATIADLHTLQLWDEKEHVIASDPNDDWNWEVELKLKPVWREQLIAELNGRPIGFIQIIDPALEVSHYWGNITEPNYMAIDIWIGEENDLGKGYGEIMMQQAVERCFKRAEVHTILIDPLESNTRSHKFYKRLGFEFVEKRKFGPDDCFVFQLTRKEWNKRKSN